MQKFTNLFDHTCTSWICSTLRAHFRILKPLHLNITYPLHNLIAMACPQQRILQSLPFRLLLCNRRRSSSTPIRYLLARRHRLFLPTFIFLAPPDNHFDYTYYREQPRRYYQHSRDGNRKNKTNRSENCPKWYADENSTHVSAASIWAFVVPEYVIAKANWQAKADAPATAQPPRRVRF